MQRGMSGQAAGERRWGRWLSEKVGGEDLRRHWLHRKAVGRGGCLRRHAQRHMRAGRTTAAHRQKCRHFAVVGGQTGLRRSIFVSRADCKAAGGMRPSLGQRCRCDACRRLSAICGERARIAGSDTRPCDRRLPSAAQVRQTQGPVARFVLQQLGAAVHEGAQAGRNSGVAIRSELGCEGGGSWPGARRSSAEVALGPRGCG